MDSSLASNNNLDAERKLIESAKSYFVKNKYYQNK